MQRQGGLRACPSIDNNMTAVGTYLKPDANNTGIVGYDGGSGNSTHWGESQYNAVRKFFKGA